MQFSGFPVNAGSVVIIDAIGEIAALLYFGQQNTTADSVHTSGREIKYITCMYLVACQYIGNSAVGNALFIFIFVYLLLETHIERGFRIGVDDIPHLAFPEFSMYSLCHFIIGMNLYAEVISGINEFHQKRHLPFILLGNMFSQYLCWIAIDERNEIHAFEITIGNDVNT